MTCCLLLRLLKAALYLLLALPVPRGDLSLHQLPLAAACCKLPSATSVWDHDVCSSC